MQWPFQDLPLLDEIPGYALVELNGPYAIRIDGSHQFSDIRFFHDTVVPVYQDSQ